jgi:predicted DNA-binding ribbon-helix-helix protein
VHVAWTGRKGRGHASCRTIIRQLTERYSVRIGSERFAGTIFVEPLIWHWLREIAADRGIPLSRVMDEIDRDYLRDASATLTT